MAVNEALIQGSKDLLYSNYLDINVPISPEQAAEIKDKLGLDGEGWDKTKDWFNSKFGGSGGSSRFKRGGTQGGSILTECPAFGSNAPGMPMKSPMHQTSDIESTEPVEFVPRRSGHNIPEVDVRGYEVNMNIERKDVEEFDRLLANHTNIALKHFSPGDVKGIDDIPGGHKVMIGLFKGAKAALAQARKDKDTETESKITNDIMSFVKQMSAFKVNQESFMEDEITKGSSVYGSIFSAASDKESLRQMKQAYSGAAEATLLGGKLHFNVLNKDGYTVLVPFDELDKNIYLKDSESELQFVDYVESVRSNALGGNIFNEAKADGTIRRMLIDGTDVKDDILKDWVAGYKGGFNFKVWFENNYGISLDFLNIQKEFDDKKHFLVDAVVEYYVDIMKNEHNIAIGKKAEQINVDASGLRAFTTDELNKINKKSQNLPD